MIGFTNYHHNVQHTAHIEQIQVEPTIDSMNNVVQNRNVSIVKTYKDALPPGKATKPHTAFSSFGSFSCRTQL